MTDLAVAEREWHDWIVATCDAVGVDPARVDVAAIHDLTRQVAHGFSRPMAPVAAFIWGVAVGQAGHGTDLSGLSADELRLVVAAQGPPVTT